MDFEKKAEMLKGRALSVMAYLKHSTVEVKTEVKCLTIVLAIAVAKVMNDPDYKAYRIVGKKFFPRFASCCR